MLFVLLQDLFYVIIIGSFCEIAKYLSATRYFLAVVQFPFSAFAPYPFVINFRRYAKRLLIFFS